MVQNVIGMKRFREKLLVLNTKKKECEANFIVIVPDKLDEIRGITISQYFQWELNPTVFASAMTIKAGFLKVYNKPYSFIVHFLRFISAEIAILADTCRKSLCMWNTFLISSAKVWR